MSRWLLVAVCLTGCIPELVSPDGDNDSNQVWEAPENRWPTFAPPDGLQGEGFENGNVAPDFLLQDQYGDMVSMWQFYGQIVVLDISTMWCSPCRELAEGVEHTANEFADKGVVYMTLLPEDVERETPDVDDLNQWGDFFGITQPILSDPERGYSADAVPGEAFPQVYIVGRDMRVWERLSVPTDANLVQRLDVLLEQEEE